MSAANRGTVRAEADNYPTPSWCVRRILAALRLPPNARILEPSAGDGAIIRVVRSMLPRARITGVELRDVPRCPEANAWIHDDFLGVRSTLPSYDAVIMNPPYSAAFEFVRGALELSSCVIALFRLNFLEGSVRSSWLREHTPSVYVLPQRPSFTGKGTDATAYGWFVWGLHDTPQLSILPDTPLAERRLG